jgi:uncharacterized protein (TIGR03437 family)
MKLQLALLLLTAAAPALAQSRIQPTIAPNGIVNAASYLPPGFANQGIARGSLFVIFGSSLGPDTLVQAATFPLPGTDGLAGTRIRIDAGGFTGFALMVYTSAKQVGAVLPSATPEGSATLTLNYNNLTSNPVVIRVVRSAFGMFALSQAGQGPAVAQNFVSQSQLPVNTILNSATPGQTIVLWGTGLGPVAGDESAGPLPGALPFLDTLLIGGQTAIVRYAGRSGCCAGVDQIVFDVPASVSGCYLPIVVLTNGLASNTGTLAVSRSGGACDDPVSFRAADLAAPARNANLALGTIQLWQQAASAPSPVSVMLTGNFGLYTPQTIVMAPGLVNPSAGSCLLTQTAANPDPSALPRANPLNAGGSIAVNGPGATFSADLMTPGFYSATASPALLSAGAYVLTGTGGPDVGSFRATITAPVAVQWSNAAAYQVSAIVTGQPMTFQWTGGDPTGHVVISIGSSNTTLASSIVCNASVTAGSFTVPGYLTAGIVQGQGTISVGFAAAASPFAATGLDVGKATPAASTTVQANFQNPPGGN